MLDLFEVSSIQYKVGWFVEVSCYCAVNCYALISGYVGCSSKFRHTNILYLWIQVVFYSVGITFVLYYIFPDKVNLSDIMKAFFPVTNNKYWYYTAYFGMSFFIPALNHLINTMENSALRTVVFSIFIVISLYPTVVRVDPFNIESGFCMLWLACLYLIGGYIRKCPIGDRMTPRKCFLIYFLMITISWISKLYTNMSSEGTEYINLVRYTSPTILVSAIVLVVGLSSCSFEKTKRFIEFFSKYTFSVYLIHANGLVYSNFMFKKYTFVENYNTVQLLVFVLVCSLLWFLGCTIIDFMRLCLFKKLKVKQRCEQLVNILQNIVRSIIYT